jgi:hypothetical protein
MNGAARLRSSVIQSSASMIVLSCFSGHGGVHEFRGGFTQVRRVAETPLNMVLEARH